MSYKHSAQGSSWSAEQIPGQLFLDLEKEAPESSSGIITLAKSGNMLYELRRPVPNSSAGIEWIDTATVDGQRAYMRSLSFVFLVAVERTFTQYQPYIEHSVSGGLYCTLRDQGNMVQPDSHMKNAIRSEMRRLIDADFPICREEIPLEEAKRLFLEKKEFGKAELLNYREEDTIGIYTLDGERDHFFGYLVPNTKRLSVFDVELFRKGLVLLGVQPGEKGVVRNFYPQYKLSEIYNENEDWSKLQGIDTVASLNRVIEAGGFGEVVRMSEDLQRSKIHEIAERIYREHRRIILIAAPSCSGKTSFAYKLRTELAMMGLKPQAISLDDYYVNREDTPLDEHGNYDFESLQAIDLQRFNDDLNQLLAGRPIERIRFEFVEGKRQETGEWFSLGRNDPVIIEGIHGLNPELTASIPKDVRFRIYLSVITHINLDEHNRIPTTDLRLLRRLARDSYSRGRNVYSTLKEWPAVRRGEERNIFPYQEEADALFNSSFLYEISVFRPIVEPMLKQVTPDDSIYPEVSRLHSMLQYFVPVHDVSDIVNTSIFREFIGGSKLVP